MSATSQLHNPTKAVWFLGAPVSKAIAISTTIVYIIAEMNKAHSALILGELKQVCGVVNSSLLLQLQLISSSLMNSISYYNYICTYTIIHTDTTKIFDHAQFYRIFVCNLTFGSMGELVFGLLALCPLMRRFEREVSS